MCSDSEKRGSFFKEQELIAPKRSRGIMRVVRAVDISCSVEERVGKREREAEGEAEGSMRSKGCTSQRQGKLSQSQQESSR